MKIIRIIAAILAASVLLIQPAAEIRAEGAFVVKMETNTSSVKAGDIISVKVGFTRFPNITRFGPMEVTFDPEYVSFTGMDKGASMPSTFSVTSTASTGVISIAGLDQTVEKQIADNLANPVDPGGMVEVPADPSLLLESYIDVCILYFKVVDNVKKGEAKISLGNLGGFRNSSGEQVTATAGDPVTVAVESVLSVDASLSALSIQDGLLTPDFSPSVYEYEIHVPRGQTSVQVIATPLDPAATVTVKGAENLLVGTNTVSVDVTAQDGKTALSYSIKVIRDSHYVPEGAKITDKNGKEYLFAELPQSLTLPFQFVQETRVVNDITVPVFTGSGVRRFLLYLQEGENAPEFYQYHPDSGEIRKFLPAATLLQPAGLLTLTKVTAGVSVPSGFSETDITINGISAKGYVSADNITIVYLTNEAGKSGFYTFDQTDGSLYPYVVQGSSDTFLMPFIVVGGIAVAEFAMLAFIIYQIRRRRSPPEEVRHV